MDFGQDGLYPKVSVLVLNYNGARFLYECLQSLKVQTYPNYEIVVVDNASSDDSLAIIKNNFDQVTVISNSQNLGYPKAYNQAAAAGSIGDYILFLNVDTKAHPNMLEALVTAAAGDLKTGVCGCTQVSYDGARIINSGLTTDFLGYPTTVSEPKKALYADGASLFIRAEVFREVGGFDSSYFLYGEDIDLCWRVILAGYDVRTVQSAIVAHASGGTVILAGRKYDIKLLRRYLFERNSLRTILKNYSIQTLAYVLPVRMILTGYQIVFFLAVGPRKFSIALLQGLLWNAKNMRDTLRLRTSVQASRKVSDWVVLQRMARGFEIVRAFTIVRQRSSSVNWNA